MTEETSTGAEGLALAMKKELRKRMRGLRVAATRESCLERSARIATSVLAELDARGAAHVALFASIESRNEVELLSVDRACRASGRHLYYPSIDDERVMTMRLADDLATFEERGLGFREPPPEAPEAQRLDAIVVPALAVDARGYRLGYGAGFYDRTLPKYCPPAVSIVVAFDYQLLAELPVLPHDVACDLVVTDARVLRSRV